LIEKHPLAALWSTVIGKKVVMAVTGTVLVCFVIGHMLGNLKIFSGAQDINSYARFLRQVGNPELGYGELLWVVRVVLLSCVILHITAAVQLSRISWQARPQSYCVKKDLRATFASRTLRWGGILLAIFIVFHLLHLTVGPVGFRAGQFHDLAVCQNVVAAFSIWPVSAFYVLAMAALGLHLDHGIWSACQTLGLNSIYNEYSLRFVSRTVALLVFLDFISVPAAVVAGWVR
jgi:succinate dehydrogenase / fumarate reductase cytochrome b subunit